MRVAVFLENMPRGLAPGARFLSLRSGNHRASSNLEEHFFVLSRVGVVFLLSQLESGMAQVGHSAASQESAGGGILP